MLSIGEKLATIPADNHQLLSSPISIITQVGRTMENYQKVKAIKAIATDTELLDRANKRPRFTQAENFPLIYPFNIALN